MKAFRICIVSLISLLGLLVAGPTAHVLAGAPFFEVVTFDETFEQPRLSVPCGFTVYKHLAVRSETPSLWMAMTM